jgi:hypothetical protein
MVETTELDPYDGPGERKEIFTFYSGPFSTWREIHISIRAIAAGLRAGQLAQVPPCPAMWLDEGQYWDGCSMLANVAKIYGFASVATLAGAVVALKTNGVV